MNKLIALIVVGVVVLSSTMVAFAEIYKWKDADGKTRYADTLPSSNLKYERIGKYKSDVKSAQINNQTLDAAKVETKAPVKTAEGNAKVATEADIAKADNAKKMAEKEAKQQEAEVNQQNCQTAKQNATTYKNGGRIKRANEKGEMVFMSDAEIASAKAAAEHDVAKYCGA